MLEDFDKAIFDFSKAIELDSGYANAYINRGSILKEKGEFKKALLDYNVVVKLNPDDLKALEERADLLFVDEAYQNAIEDYDELISKSYEKPSVYRKRADAKYFNFNYRGAIQDYSKSILLNPLDSYAYNNLAWLLATCPDRKFRDGNEAVYNSIKAVKLDDNKYNLHTLSAAYAALGKYDQSVLVMNRILKNYVWDDKELIVLKGHLEEFEANRSLWKLPGE
jgi:tetratricopeptide (TPR) repeat protein